MVIQMDKESTGFEGSEQPSLPQLDIDGAPAERALKFFESIPEEFRPPDPETPRGRIIEAARQLFADRGFEATSTRSIAETAGVNLAMIHYYYGTKEKLYRRVMASVMLNVFRNTAQTFAAGKSPEEVVIAIPLGILSTIRQHPELARLIRREIGSGCEQLSVLIEEFGDYGPISFQQLLRRTIEEGIERGKLYAYPPESIIPFVIAVSHGMILAQPIIELIMDIDLSDNLVWADFIRVHEKLIRHGIMRPEGNDD